MKLQVKGRVTVKMIRKGVSSSTDCPVARALTSAGGTDVNVNEDEIQFTTTHGTRIEVATPKKLAKFIVRFDGDNLNEVANFQKAINKRRSEMKPFDFVLTL